MPPETLRDVRVYPLWQGLLANLSAVALCLAVMLLSFEVQPGVHFDLCGALMVNVVLFGVPLAAGVAFATVAAQPMMDGNIWHLIVPMVSMMFLATLLAGFGLILAFDAAEKQRKRSGLCLVAFPNRKGGVHVC
jgi:hypothetical protein